MIKQHENIFTIPNYLTFFRFLSAPFIIWFIIAGHQNLGSLITFISLGVICLLHSFIKFGKISSLHTYATKTGGYMQGIFFFVLFAYGFIPVLYYIMITWAILSVIEMIIIQLIIPDMQPNKKGLYWVLKGPR